MKNYAGQNEDAAIAKELEEAGISVVKIPERLRGQNSEVKTVIQGELYLWGFERAWYYWIAEGPGIPPNYAEEIHKKFGKVVRVGGHVDGPSPKEWCGGFAVGLYHVDTQEGLNALADTIRQIVKDNNQNS